MNRSSREFHGPSSIRMFHPRTQFGKPGLMIFPPVWLWILTRANCLQLKPPKPYVTGFHRVSPDPGLPGWFTCGHWLCSSQDMTKRRESCVPADCSCVGMWWARKLDMCGVWVCEVMYVACVHACVSQRTIPSIFLYHSPPYLLCLFNFLFLFTLFLCV